MSFQEEYASVETKVKAWWRSKTIWFNSVMASAPVALSMLSDQVPSLQPYLPHNVYGLLFVITTLGNVWLRFETTTGIKK